MNSQALERFGLLSLAIINGVFIVPQIRRGYRYFYQQHPTVTHFCYFDIEIDGNATGRIDFELFGEEAPKTVNNFLGLASGGMGALMWYKGSGFHRINS